MVGIVGESGSGKTQAARAIMGLTPAPLVVAGGAILFEGVDVTKAEPAVLRKLRGARIGMVFQEPMTSLNPSMPIGRQLDEGLKLHRKDLSTAQRRERILEMLRRVGIRDPQGAMDAWPHEFSGGMRQRMMLASVMLLEPALLIADEPTTALDAVVQRDVLELMVDLTREHHTAVLMISHDLPMVARYTERMVVMQHGKVLETGTTAGILERPQHPYTRKLLDAMPRRLPARKLAPEAPIVEVKNLVVDYAGHQRLFSRTGAKRALNGIDLHVQPREVVAVVGGSGSGKTTLGRAIAGLLSPTSGQILFRNQLVNRRSPRLARLPAELPDGVPGPLFVAGPAHDHRPTGGRRPAHAGRHAFGGQATPRGRGAGRGRPGLRIRQALSARNVRRPAPGAWRSPAPSCAGPPS